jgi:hypothetical protein
MDYLLYVAHQVHVIERLRDLGQFGCVIRVKETGQKVQVAIALLDSLQKLLDQNHVGLFQLVADKKCWVSAASFQKTI